jgi:hypothetical protein
MITIQQAAAIKTLTADEHDALWSSFMTLACEGDHVSRDDRAKIEDMIKTAPVHMRRLMPHCNTVEFVGYFPWQRFDRSIGLVSVSICEDDSNAVCMCDVDHEDWSYFHSTRIAE